MWKEIFAFNKHSIGYGWFGIGLYAANIAGLRGTALPFATQVNGLVDSVIPSAGAAK